MRMIYDPASITYHYPLLIAIILNIGSTRGTQQTRLKEGLHMQGNMRPLD
jgi:hypothetical protein